MEKPLEKVDLSLIICCFNEENLLQGNMARLIRFLEHTDLSYEIIFVDDCSMDGTKAIINQFIDNNPLVKTKKIFHNKNLGRGAAFRSGFQVAEGTVVGYLDIDLEVAEHYILSCCLAIVQDGYDVCVGNRIYKVNLLPSSVLRHLMSVTYSRLVRLLLKLNTADTETGYKFFNRETVGPIMDQTRSNHWFWDTEIMILCERAGLRIEQVNCLFMRNRAKKSTVKIVKDVFYYLAEIYRFYKTGSGGNR